MAERVLDGEAVEESLEAADLADSHVRPLPERRTKAELESWRGEVTAIAVVAAGGLAAGAAAVAAVSAAKSRSGSRGRAIKRMRRDRDVVASRSFLVDVHVLGR